MTARYRHSNSEHAPPVPPRASLDRTRWRSGSTPDATVKCVLVGDGDVGKTSLIVSYTTNGYPAEHVPTAFDNFTVTVDVDGRPVQLHLCDTAGQDDLECLRPFCYRDADVFLLCYSIVAPSSFHSVRERWAPEVHRLHPVAPLVLVGTQSDLREDVQVLIQLARQQERPISVEEARLVARSLGVSAFAECSALTQKNLKAVFDTAIMVSLEHKEQPKGLRRRVMVRNKTPEKLRQLSQAWWKKLSCFM
ncbi:rho-related GTP-binding protein RhoU [Tachysurus fulvidraco]|uniref:rho-related GTP-binding protein RhoU n=1 Tax=Tachysurus fulvidraco TaxID=1234273 RepID=UPI000F4ECCC0|nr:rho-related GTP-binding protein RhoU [Tachysurus fulvidraco]